MNQICTDCRIPVSNAEATKRSISLKLVVCCRPCAEDRGWIDPARPVLSLVAS